MARGYQCALPQAAQNGTKNRPSRAASQNGLVSGFTAGGVIFRAITSLPLHDQRAAAVPRGKKKPGTLRQCEVAVLDLDRRMRLAAQLPHRLDYLGHAAAIGGMVVAQPAAVGVERQLSRAGDEIAVGHELAARALGAEAEILELDDDGDGEAVVDRGVFDVGGGHPGLGEGDRPGPRRARRRDIEGAAGEMLYRLAGADDLDQRPLELFGDLRPNDDDRAAAVADHAAIEPMQRGSDRR